MLDKAKIIFAAPSHAEVAEPEEVVPNPHAAPELWFRSARLELCKCPVEGTRIEADVARLTLAVHLARGTQTGRVIDLKQE